MDLHSFSNLDPDRDPHSPKKLNPDPHKVYAKSQDAKPRV
jgi:hypothetical protein